MKKILFTALLIAFVHLFSWAQINKGLIDLGKTHSQFYLLAKPSDSVLNDLNKYDTTELSFVADFIQEATKPNSKLLSETFLKRPSDKDIKLIYIIKRISYNARKEVPRDNEGWLQNFLKRKSIRIHW